MIRRLDHVAVAVADTGQSLAYLRDRLGLRVAAVDEPPGLDVRLTYLDLGNAWLQLVQPLTHDHPIARWLVSNGDGLHHICFGVDSVEAELRRIGPAELPVPTLGSGRGRPAGFPAGEPPHGVRIECTVFDPRDLADLPGALGSSLATVTPTPLEISRSYWQAECQRDLDAILRHYHVDGCYADADGSHRGLAAIREAYSDSISTYPGLEVEILQEFSQGSDASAIEFSAVLTDRGGVRHRIHGINVVRARDGKFVSVRSFEDPPSVE